MKTLLLTLVVVTIVCLDLGYTLKCYVGRKPYKLITCPEGSKKCATVPLPTRPLPIFSKGCYTSCPSQYVKCCSTDLCNGSPTSG
uniref:Three-finger toxin MALT0070C n=1 Tax=Micrurus altirostris TaxID=129457 RepID=3SX0_MICAT|nr:RecName: Full=Three-finger toxin MALT0070C; Short=3FTx MALT0070C; Flags: Precursor [Micrurus altirostris]AED89573.1 putative three finger toxin precursor [Micrurus altirostris]